MSLYDYHVSQDLAALDPPFDALIMAALNKADTANLATLTRAYPELADEFSRRYHAPAGILPGEENTCEAVLGGSPTWP